MLKKTSKVTGVISEVSYPTQKTIPSKTAQSTLVLSFPTSRRRRFLGVCFATVPNFRPKSSAAVSFQVSCALIAWTHVHTFANCRVKGPDFNPHETRSCPMNVRKTCRLQIKCLHAEAGFSAFSPTRPCRSRYLVESLHAGRRSRPCHSKY